MFASDGSRRSNSRTRPDTNLLLISVTVIRSTRVQADSVPWPAATDHLREGERELAGAILEGSKRRTDQAFGYYYRAAATATARSAAYEGIYRLPDTADGVRPQRLDRLFEYLEGVVRTCPECSKKKLPLGALIVHLNDAHHWTRERIAAWVADPDVPQDESHAHH